ncbi:MAG TPA: IPT/TIG domain-containing protein, partial [Candidatus Methylomirabilis sp.]|nr:IPT/TIG domain-containing protein [Candidatus Methylomirabilis sp.]
VKSPSGTNHVPTDVTQPSDIGLSFGGTRADLSVSDIIAALGPRIPDVSTAPKVFRQATILLARQGTSPSSADLDKLVLMQQRFQQYFGEASGGLGVLDLSLNAIPVEPVINSITPVFGSTLGNTRVYISGSNFQNGATVRIGAAAASNVQVVNSSLIIATTPAGTAGRADVVVTNPGAQPATLASAYTYRVLAPASVPSNALRIPYVVDSQFFRSNLGINNPNPAAAAVRISHLDSNGLLASPVATVAVPAHGYLQIDSLLRYLQGATSVTGLEGSLVLESDQPVEAFVSQIDNQSGDPSILDGIRAGASRLLLQSAANTGPFRSNLRVLNLSSSPAMVDLTALDRDTGQAIGTPLDNLSVAGNGYLSLDNVLAALGVPDAYGPVAIQSRNGALLAAVSQVSGLNADTSGFFVAQAADSGSGAEVIPFVIDSAAFRTNLGLNNLGTGTAHIQVTLIGSDGSTLAGPSAPFAVAPLGMLQINGIVRFLLGSTSVTNQQGYLRLSSDQPMRAFATQIDNISQDPGIETSVSSGSSHLLLKSSANTNFQSSLVIVNPGSSAVTVTVTARQGESSGNGTLTGTRSLPIAAGGYYASDNILADLGASSVFGPIEIQSDSGQPLIAVSRVYNTAGHTSGFFSLQPLP